MIQLLLGEYSIIVVNLLLFETGGRLKTMKELLRIQSYSTLFKGKKSKNWYENRQRYELESETHGGCKANETIK